MNYFNKFIFVICFFYVTNAGAQNKDLYNVKLKSGLVIKCELLRVVTDSFVVIRQYGQVNTIKYDEIESISFSETRGTSVVISPEESNRSQPVRAKPVQPQRKNIPDKQPSFGVQTGLCFGQTDDFPTVSILLRLSVLTGITKRLQAGGAVGLDPYLQYNIVLGSVLGDARYYFKKDKPQSPFLHTQFGYGFNFNSHQPAKEGGLTYNFGVGQSFRDNSQNIFSMMLGYRFQKASEEREIWDQWGNRTVTLFHEFNRVEFKVEFRF